MQVFCCSGLFSASFSFYRSAIMKYNDSVIWNNRIKDIIEKPFHNGESLSRQEWRKFSLAPLIFLVLLVFINAFFAASEIALISLNDNKLRMMAEDGDKKAITLKKLLNEPSKFLATIQIGITLAGFLASAIASESFADQLVNLVKSTGLNASEVWLKPISVLIITLILSYFTLVFGELVPKRLAMTRAEPISRFAVGPLTTISVVTYPFVRLLTKSTNFFVRLLGVDPNARNEEVTEEEIRMMVDVGEENGTIHETEKLMINNVFEFNNKTCEEIMTHRTDIMALPVEADLNEVTAAILSEKYTRIPVYEDNIDHIIGILHIKDMFPYLCEESSFDLRKVIREPYFVPASKRTDILFTELQRKKTHIVILIDEYGGTAGIVTIEDLIEEIVGNIFDEYDDDDNEFEKIDDNTFHISGSASLEDVNDYLGAELPVDDYDTLSGFIIGQLGKIPRMEEELFVEFGGFLFKVVSIKGKRILKVKVCKT